MGARPLAQGARAYRAAAPGAGAADRADAQPAQGARATQTEVAELLWVTQSNVSKIEVRGDPSLSVLERIAEARGKRLRLVVESGEGEIETSFALS